MKKDIFILLIIFIIVITRLHVFSQTCNLPQCGNCEFDDTYITNSSLVSPSVNNFCDDLLRYIPGYITNADLHPLYKIRITAIIVQDLSGNSEYTDDYQQDFNYFNYLINNYVNPRLHNLQPPTFTNPNPTLEQTDTKFEFELHELYYVQDATLHTITSHSQFGNSPTKIYDLYGKNKDTDINLILANSTLGNPGISYGIGYYVDYWNNPTIK